MAKELDIKIEDSLFMVSASMCQGKVVRVLDLGCDLRVQGFCAEC